jgi:hypothetical protein
MSNFSPDKEVYILFDKEKALENVYDMEDLLIKSMTRGLDSFTCQGPFAQLTQMYN